MPNGKVYECLSVHCTLELVSVSKQEAHLHSLIRMEQSRAALNPAMDGNQVEGLESIRQLEILRPLDEAERGSAETSSLLSAYQTWTRFMRCWSGGC
jgi:hypothetical protein